MLNNFNCINQARPCLNEDYYTIMSKFLMNKDIRYIEKPLTALAEMGHKDALIAYLLNFKNMNSSTISPKVKEQLSEISYRDGFEAALVKLAEVYCEDYKTIQILQNGMIGMYRNVKNKAFKSQDIHFNSTIVIPISPSPKTPILKLFTCGFVFKYL